MGNRQAQELADAVQESAVSLESAVTTHLRFNHFPSIDAVFVPVAMEAIERADADDWDSTIELPNKVVLTVSKIIEELHLDNFLGVA